MTTIAASSLQDMREQRANAWSQAQDFRTRFNGGETMTADDQAAWTRALDDIDRLGTIIGNEERSANLEQSFAAIDASTVVVGAAGTPESRAADQYRSAFDKFVRRGLSALDTEERALMQANFDPELRAQGVASGAAGGYTVPQGFWAKVTETMKFYGGVLASGVEVNNTETGNTLPWPTNDDTSNTGALLSENSQIGGGDLTFGQKQLNAYTYTSKLILASIQFLQDTGIDAEAFIGKKVGLRLGRIYNNHWTVGTGSSQPQGFITGGTVGKTTSGATAITYGETIDLIHSVDVAYRNGPSVGFQFHDLVLAYLRKLLDSQNRPLWQPSLQANVPDTFNGYPYWVNNDMASTVATTNKTMAFGNWSEAYVVRQVAGGQLLRLEERYADSLQVGFFGFGRMDGVLQDPSAIKILQQA